MLHQTAIWCRQSALVPFRGYFSNLRTTCCVKSRKSISLYLLGLSCSLWNPSRSMLNTASVGVSKGYVKLLRVHRDVLHAHRQYCSLLQKYINKWKRIRLVTASHFSLTRNCVKTEAVLILKVHRALIMLRCYLQNNKTNVCTVIFHSLPLHCGCVAFKVKHPYLSCKENNNFKKRAHFKITNTLLWNILLEITHLLLFIEIYGKIKYYTSTKCIFLIRNHVLQSYHGKAHPCPPLVPGWWHVTFWFLIFYYFCCTFQNLAQDNLWVEKQLSFCYFLMLWALEKSK